MFPRLLCVWNSVSKSSGCFCQDLYSKKHFSPALPFWLKSVNTVTTLGMFFRWIQKRILQSFQQMQIWIFDLMNPFWKRIHWIWNPKNPNPDCKRISDLCCSIHSGSKISQMIQWYFSGWGIPVKFNSYLLPFAVKPLKTLEDCSCYSKISIC